jgi:GR25 family glycosyltransferase involved in LPS biosynthesis
MPDLFILAINLDRSVDRWQRIEEGFSKLPWPLERIRAVDAVDVEQTLAFRGQRLDLPPDAVGWSMPRRRAFTLVEEACLCSHLKALRRFLESPVSHALILEDDAVPQKGMVALLQDGIDHLQRHQLLKLSGNARKGSRLAIVERAVEHFRVVRSFRPTSNAGAYMVGREAAEALLAGIGKLLLPYDDYLSAPRLHGCEVLQVAPWPVVCSGMPSTMRPHRKSSRHVKLRAAPSLVIQAFRRASLRAFAWGSAARWSPFDLLQIRDIPWHRVEGD